MKRVLRAVLITILALTVAVSSLIVVSAEVNRDSQDETSITVCENDGVNVREYELVWKYKESQGHLWKRRWNMTLGIWYDPAWILVY